MESNTNSSDNTKVDEDNRESEFINILLLQQVHLCRRNLALLAYVYFLCVCMCVCVILTTFSLDVKLYNTSKLKQHKRILLQCSLS